MSTIDSKVVELKFDNKGFADGVKNTLKGLDDLNQKLNRGVATSGLDNLGKAADGVSRHFSLMQVAGVAAFATLASKAASSAIETAKAFTTGPIAAGFNNYETKINAIQTILANTGLEGAKGMAQVTAVLKDLNTYANQTVYNFADMTKNIGTFTAAGVDLKTASGAIKGIANLAALSGATAEQASGGMYQLSQAIAANKVQAQDWNSVVNAGIAGKVFQKALFNTGEALHRIKGVKVGESFEQWTKSGQTFKASLKDGWINAKVLTQTLAGFTGDMTTAQLKSQGYNAVQIAQIQKMGKIAVESATKIKTVTQLQQALKEEVATAYGSIFETLIGNIGDAKKTLSTFHTFVENGLTNPIYAINKVLEKWVALGGRVRFIDGLKYAFKDLKAIIVPIQHAFNTIFPSTTAKRLYTLTNNVEKFFQFLKIGPKTAQNLKHTFEGLFAVLDIGKTVIKAAAHFIGELFKQLLHGEGSSGFLSITGHIGLFLVSLDKTIKKGHGLADFFNNLLGYLKTPIKYFHELTQAVAELFGGKASKGGNDLEKKLSPVAKIGQNIAEYWAKVPPVFNQVIAWIQKVITQIKPFAIQVGQGIQKAAEAVRNFVQNIDFNKVKSVLVSGAHFIVSAFANISHAVQAVAQFIKPLLPIIEHFFSSAAHGIGNFFSHIDYSQVLNTINTALFGGLVLLIRQFLGKSSKQLGGGLGFLKKITEPFEELTKTLKTFQEVLKAQIILELAIAIGILAAACVALSLIKPPALAGALKAIGTMMAELLGSIVLFSKFGGATNLVATSAGLVLFAGAILVLTGAVVRLSKIEDKSLQKGLQSLAILMGEVVVTARLLGKAAPLMISGGAGLVIMSAAIKILSKVVEDLGKQNVETLKKGLISVGSLLGGLAIFSQLQSADAGGVLAGAGLILLAEAIKRLGASVKVFGNMDTKVLRKGLIAIGAILAGFALFSRGVGNPASVLAAAGAMVIISFAMVKLGDSVERFGKFSWTVIGKGLAVMAGALASIALALGFLPPTVLLSAAAIFVVASSLKKIGEAMVIFGGMSWEEIAKGLVGLAGALAIIALAMAGMTTAIFGAAALVVVAAALKLFVPELVILGGLSWKQIGLGLLALAGSFAVLGIAAALLTPVIPSLLGLGASILLLGAGVALIGGGVFLLALGLTAISAAGAGAAIAITAIVTAIVKLIPVIVVALVQGVTILIEGLAKVLPELLTGVQKILLDLIKLIVKVAPPLISAIILVLGKLLNALAAHAPKFFRQMVGLLLALIRAIEAKTPDIVKSALNIVIAIVKGLAYHVKDFIIAGGDIVINIIKGLTARVPDIVAAAVDFIIAFVDGLANQAIKLVDAALNMIVTLINGVADAVRTNTQPLIDAGENLAGAIIDGLVKGLKDVGGKIAGSIKDAGNGIVDGFKSVLHINSPSKRMIEIGHSIGEGLVIGIRDGNPGVKAAFQQVSGLLNQAVTDSANSISTYKQNLVKSNENVLKTAEKVDVLTKRIAEASKNHKTAGSVLERYNQQLKDAKEAHTKAAEEVRRYTELLKTSISEHKNAKLALNDLNDKYKVEHNALLVLGTAYDNYNKQLDIQKQKLTDLKQVRDDYNKSVVDSFNVLPDVTTDTTVGSFTTGLQEQVADLAKFTEVLGELRKQGLDDATYKLLVSKGPVALPFMEELLAQGASGISNINQLDSQLNTEAQALGSNASNALYQAGIDIVQGLVDGLTAQTTSIESQMNRIADVIITSLKKSLGISSPSKEMAILGSFAADGLIKGLSDSSGSVATASAKLGVTASDALKKSISGLMDSVSTVTNLTPTITPILDLSSVKKSADQLTGLLTPGPVVVNDAYLKARAASASYRANQEALSAAAITPTAQATTPLVFNQYNNSPKALSSAEIYRNTKNQLSVTKGALTKSVA